MIFDLFPYFLLLLPILFPVLLNKKITKGYYWACVVLLTLFSAFRYGVGWDYYAYIGAIERADWQVERFEFLPRQFAYFCHNIGAPRLFIIVTGALTVLLYAFIIIKESKDLALSLLAFVCIPMFFLESLSTIRFSLAIAILFCAYRFRDKPLLYILLAVTAFFVHKATILGIFALPFFKKIKVGIVANWILFGISLIVSFTSGIMAPYVSYFINSFSNLQFLEDTLTVANSYMSNASEAGFSRLPYAYAAINVLNLSLYGRFAKLQDASKALSFITLFNIGCSLMLFLSFDAVFASRLGQSFMVFFILLLPYYRYLKANLLLKGLVIVIVLLFFIQLSIQGYNDDFIGRRNCFLPYRSLLFTKL